MNIEDDNNNNNNNNNNNKGSEVFQPALEEQNVPEKYRHRSLINQKYLFDKKIGSGSFGSVYKGKNVISDEPVAIKFEAVTTNIPTLLWESKILNHLVGTQGVVKLRYFGTEANKNIIVMDLFSHTLYEEINQLKVSQTKEDTHISGTKEQSNSTEVEMGSEHDTHPTYSSPQSSIEHNMSRNDSDTGVSKIIHIASTTVVSTEMESLKPIIKPHILLVVKYLISMIEIIERVHEAGVVHRDIKPENFMISERSERSDRSEGGGGANIEKRLHIIDFGLSRFYMKGDKHVSKTSKSASNTDTNTNNNMVGTIRYMSMNIHKNEIYTRRDDIISIMYVAIYFARGNLPWSGLIPEKGDTRQKDELVYDKKIKTTSMELCENIPRVFQKLLDYSYSLKFEDKPDYVYMIRQCKNFLKLYI
jgi:serine/threonine protein kinase